MKKIKKKIGFILSIITVSYLLLCSILIDNFFIRTIETKIHYAIIAILFLISVVLNFDFTNILFDPDEDTANKSKKDIVKKMRYRAVLFNNIAIILFIMTCVIIFISSSFLIDQEIFKRVISLEMISIKLSAAVFLIFLVQILFKVFKYLLRVAAFYHARADSIEFISFDDKMDLEKMMNLLTPDKYDITELESINILSEFINKLKGK